MYLTREHLGFKHKFSDGVVDQIRNRVDRKLILSLCTGVKLGLSH